MQNALYYIYHQDIACLNRQGWSELGEFVADDVVHNGRSLGLRGYREMLKRDFREIPDLHFDVELMVVDEGRVASRLMFECSPTGTFLGLAVNGKRVAFAENAIYEFRDRKIAEVWSVIDKAAIEAQLL